MAALFVLSANSAQSAVTQLAAWHRHMANQARDQAAINKAGTRTRQNYLAESKHHDDSASYFENLSVEPSCPTEVVLNTDPVMQTVLQALLLYQAAVAKAGDKFEPKHDGPNAELRPEQVNTLVEWLRAALNVRTLIRGPGKVARADHGVVLF